MLVVLDYAIRGLIGQAIRPSSLEHIVDKLQQALRYLRQENLDTFGEWRYMKGPSPEQIRLHALAHSPYNDGTAWWAHIPDGPGAVPVVYRLGGGVISVNSSGQWRPMASDFIACPWPKIP